MRFREISNWKAWGVLHPNAGTQRLKSYIYYSTVYSIIQYGIIIWGGSYNKYKDKLNKTHNKY